MFHISGQVSVKISRVSKADHMERFLVRSDLDGISAGERQRFMPIHTDDRFMFRLDLDANRGTFCKDDRAVNG